jgi:GNAT superfamily N-acetyltransferase
MSITLQKHNIRILEYISQTDFDQINTLMEQCISQDQINLKLEHDYKLHLSNLAAKDETKVSGKANEFLYYYNDELVAYLGISCFDGVTGELCGMTHPMHRNKGFFHRLLSLASNECRHSNYGKLLILADGKSESGMSFLKTNGSSYAHSEYRMKRLSTIASSDVDKELTKEVFSSNEPAITTSELEIRSAVKADEKVIARQNAIYFGEEEIVEETGEYKITPLEDNPENYKTYMIDLEGISIGKINVDYSDGYAFICGFGILPEYRRRGFGRQAMLKTIHLIEAQGINTIELDVVCTNQNALGLYQSCGFEEQSVMNYYHLTV